MFTTERRGAVAALMVELAEADARTRTVNEALYARSLAYQETLDRSLGRRGCYLARLANGRHEVRARAASEPAPVL
jgi:hypothetical protein